eukprot:CAMPEP_0206426354 /NCGR_PEP_ID=MMETSP0324_2-20121206/4327_1 /ASSEMBLY_ACC=CAM_ASM_000836 /TAXON_ID=2866 /ORGANISM="Crypthecodinium cohnii, Strain Seligo" /LENGTH=165 /DNA_ID=CAMNT_0053891291 /DNA_START=171 /DNA_END=668 /DNA_ORIENTATION=-
MTLPSLSATARVLGRRAAQLGPQAHQLAFAPLARRGFAAAPRASGWKSLSFSQKTVYGGALLNILVVAFVWLKRQLKMADREAKELEETKSLESDMDMGNWNQDNKFRCFFAAQRYHMLAPETAEEELSPEVQKLVSVMSQCREELYRKLPDDLPAMRPIERDRT